MKMDTLSWTKLAPTIKVVDTKKKFFNNYLYKVVIDVPAGRLMLNKSNDPMHYQIEELRQLIQNKTVYSTSWSAYSKQRQLHRLNRANADQLEYFKNIIEVYRDTVKSRVEEPKLSLYSADEATLLLIAKKYKDDIIEVHRPLNNAAAEILNKGEIIVKRKIEYQYKVVFKESGTFDADVREQVYNYLKNLGDTVKLTKSCEINLKTRKYWFTQTYFYTNNPDILTFLNIIAPGYISGIFKLTNLEQ